MAYTTIDRSSDYFRVKLYTGNGSTQSITFDESKAMQPDLTWIKVRNDANVTLVHDVIRGATKEIYTSLTNAEATDANGLTAFNSNGFSVGSAFGVNRSGYNFVNWSWKANGTGVSNTAGTISSTVSANTTSGFSIVSYTGDGVNNRTVGHGLGVTPKFIIIKNRDNGTAYWSVINPRSTSTTDTNILYLNRTDAEADDTNIMGTNLPNSTTFGIGNYAGVNVNGNKHIAYCFADVKGFSKAFSYTGNGSSDGTFVYTGMRPAWVMIKYSSGANESWAIFDNKRNVYNPESLYLYANTSGSEGTETGGIDFLSNGFKIRNSYGYTNNSGGTYIGFAIAENPFVSSKGIPTTAR